VAGWSRLLALVPQVVSLLVILGRLADEVWRHWPPPGGLV
jgi:hypothetical protein